MNFVFGALQESKHHKQLVQLYWIARYDYKTTWAFREHIHDFSQIIYIIDGTGIFCFSDEEYPVGPGSIHFMVPGVPHSFRVDSESMVRTIDVKFAVKTGDLFDALGKIRAPVLDRDNRVLHILERVHQEAIRNQPGHFELCNALMTEALIDILRASMDQVPEELPDMDISLNDPLVSRARAYLHERFNQVVTLKDLSSEMGASPQYLERRFRKVLGTTVHDYFLRYRIHKAKELLWYSSLTIKEIAFEAGFKTIHHFSRVFKVIENEPPASWRKRQTGIGRQGITVADGFISMDVTVDGKNDQLVGL